LIVLIDYVDVIFGVDGQAMGPRAEDILTPGANEPAIRFVHQDAGLHSAQQIDPIA
jgi:hypothetical protein